MLKKFILSLVLIGSSFCMIGCNGLFGNNSQDNSLSKRGFQYYFDNKIYETVTNELLGKVQYSAPSMEGIIKDDLRIYYGENNALILWLGDKDKDISTNKIINKYAEEMVNNIEDVADIDDVGVEFNMDLLAQDTVNAIARNKYVGVINAIGKDGIDAELNTVVYTYKIGDRPGYIMGVVTNRTQEKDQFVEIETNAQIMANTIKRK